MKLKTTLTALAGACAFALSAQVHAFNDFGSLARTLDEVAGIVRIADEAGRTFRGPGDRNAGYLARYDDDDDDRRRRRWSRDDDDDDDDDDD